MWTKHVGPVHIVAVLTNREKCLCTEADSELINRNRSQLGHDTIADGMVKDDLWDVYNDFGMGICAEICVHQHKITREEQVRVWND